MTIGDKQLRTWRVTCLFILVLLVLAPVFAEGELTPEQFERNARVLAQWRTDPEHYQRLRTALREFQALSPERQAQMRALDRDLHALGGDAQKRLMLVLERYHYWLEGLPREQRERIQQADRVERLKIIRELRQKEWVEHLPFQTRAEILQLPEMARPVLIEKIKQQEQDRQTRTRLALKLRAGLAGHPDHPALLADFPADVRRFVATSLINYLDPAERVRLDQLEGGWPAYAQTILELSRKHPILPPLRDGYATRYLELPVEWKRALPRRQLEVNGRLEIIRTVEGKWPDFALTVARMVGDPKGDLPPLGASKPEDFSPEIQTYIQEQLLPMLEDGEKDKLTSTEGHWPEYPLLLHEYAEKKDLPIPGMSLPGGRTFWEKVRDALPEVPDEVLRNFALTELSREELSSLRLSLLDPQSRERLKEAYFKKYPRQLERWRLKMNTGK